MKNERLLDAIGGIDDKLIAAAAKDTRGRKRNAWIKWGTMAACCCILAGAALLLPRGRTVVSPAGPPADSSDSPTCSEAPVLPHGQTVIMDPNEISAPEAAISMQIDLSGDDFIPLAYSELLEYFDAALPVPETLPELSLVQPASEYGIYQTDSRGVYFDCNDFLFADENGTRTLSVALAKVFMHPYDFSGLTGDELRFTQVNGRELAVFHYTDEEGNGCYYTEFVQNGVAYYVKAENIPQEDFGKCLQSLVEESRTAAAGGVHTVTGEVDVIDRQANRIGIVLDGGQNDADHGGLMIALPEGQAENYALHDRVEVSFYGEPATVGSLLEQQLVGIEVLK